jgi:hypothetical protein
MLMTITTTHRPATDLGYAVRFLPVGPEDAALGPPTQMGVFDKRSELELLP